MSVAIIGDGWWRSACEAAGEDHFILPPAVQPPANPYSADARARMAAAAGWREQFEQNRPECIVDNGAMGLAFAVDSQDAGSAKLFHEVMETPLLSQWIDPLVTVFQGLPWNAAWPSLYSDTWHKFVWDKPQADELASFGVPSVHHLPMAAMDRDYKTDLLQADEAACAVSFVGGQNTTYFQAQRSIPAESLVAGTLAQSVRAEMPDVCFYDVFFNLYRFVEPPRADESVEQRAAKAQNYFNHKLFYNAFSCIKQRDRFVIFLKHRLGDVFRLIGTNWDKAYGLPCEPQIASTDDYFEHFRKTAVNLNFVNGNSDSGLNMRHFEITAAGGFMLCYHQDEIDELFEVGRECDTFRNEHEMLEKIRFYIEHADRRKQIALAGQKRTLSEHLYSHRLRNMLNVLRDGKPALAPSVESATAV